MFFKDQDTMVFINNCLRCGKDQVLDWREGGVFDGFEDDLSPVDPSKWDA